MMNKLLVLVIAVLILFLAIGKGGGCSSGPKQSDTTFVHDTSWAVHDTIIYKKLKGKTLHDTIPTPPEYIADTNYSKLLSQYENLLGKHLALVEFKDTIKIDTIGYVTIVDTVNQNAIKGRSIRTNYKIPTITNTITIQNYEKPKAQLYFGGGIDLDPKLNPLGIYTGLILKTKKDHLLGIRIGTNNTGQINYGFNSYWKIKLK